MTSTFKLFKIMGIPIGINYSWFIIFFLIIITLAYYILPELYPDWSLLAYWIVALCTSLLFFSSLIFHELAHSFVAVRKGIEVKSITLFIFGGAAKIAREASSPGSEMLMAAAGPLSSLFLAGFFALIWWLGEAISEPLAAIGFYLCWINVALAAFNMLPGFPMDGGRVLRSIVWWLSNDYTKATRVATTIGRAFGILLILGGVAVGSLIYWYNGIWMALLGGFLYFAAWANQKQTVLRENLRGLTAGDLITGECRVVYPELNLETLVYEYLTPKGQQCLLVGDRDWPRGVITLLDVRQVPRRRWSTTSIEQAMTPVGDIGIVHPEEPALTVLEILSETNDELLLVKSDDDLIGIIQRGRLRELGRARSARG